MLTVNGRFLLGIKELGFENFPRHQVGYIDISSLRPNMLAISRREGKVKHKVEFLLICTWYSPAAHELSFDGLHSKKRRQRKRMSRKNISVIKLQRKYIIIKIT